MSENLREKFFNSLVTDKSLRSEIKKRQKAFIYESIPSELLEKYESDGWVLEKKFKQTTRMRKLKPFDIAFEDEVWSVIANLGFSTLNKDRRFRLPYSDDLTLTQQIDVFASDKETILIIECKASESEIKKGNFKETIEAIGGKKEGILKALKKLYPESKPKVRFILATRNYFLSDPDKDRLKNFDIVHYNEATISYYQGLTKHLGIAARYQFLGQLYAGKSIPELDNVIPAIQGKMGGHVYYSFSIEPEKLLKIGYILHRNQANEKLSPTYQRLIKKSRLTSIQQFVESKGFFPNSIVININTERNLRFDLASPQVETALSKIGILHFPKCYSSAFIIDGQHRLYGYANSEYKYKNSIPVVAFVNLKRKDQVKLFMQINENQKAVSKNLKNDLNADLLYFSDDLKERILALKLLVAKNLGENPESPLFGRIILGEDGKDSKRCITSETIKLGLDRSNFFGQFSKNSIKVDGSFYKGNNDDTFGLLMPFLIENFKYIKEALLEEWKKGEDGDGIVTINAAIESFIRVFSDIIDHVIKTKGINPKADSTDKLLIEVKYYLDPMIVYIKELTSDQKLELKKSYGSGLKARYWRILQRAINLARPEFNPEGFEKYWKDEAKKFNEESFKMIRDIETNLKKDFKEKLFSNYGEGWFKKGIPPQVQDTLVLSAAQKNREIENKSEEVEPWDRLNIIDYRKIAEYGSNWKDLFETLYTKPGEEKIRGGKTEKTKWMQKLEYIRNQNFHTYSVKEEEYDFLCELHEWLIDGLIESDN